LAKFLFQVTFFLSFFLSFVSLDDERTSHVVVLYFDSSPVMGSSIDGTLFDKEQKDGLEERAQRYDTFY